MVRCGFRDMPPIELWSATLYPNTDLESFCETVSALSIETGEGFSGFMIRDEDRVRAFTRTRYPRKKYGIPGVTEIAASTKLLAERLDNAPVINESTTQQKLFRVVLGLLEGYDKDSLLHTAEEVRSVLGRTSLQAAQAEVFAARPKEVSCDIYTEPCAVITGDSRAIGAVYGLANALRQQRFTIEDFDKKLAWVVETPLCTTPDPE